MFGFVIIFIVCVLVACFIGADEEEDEYWNIYEHWKDL